MLACFRNSAEELLKTDQDKNRGAVGRARRAVSRHFVGVCARIEVRYGCCIAECARCVRMAFYFRPSGVRIRRWLLLLCLFAGTAFEMCLPIILFKDCKCLTVGER